jgi:hypothetical protein
VQQKQDSYTVGDYMTSVADLYCAKESTTIDEGIAYTELYIILVCVHSTLHLLVQVAGRM